MPNIKKSYNRLTIRPRYRDGVYSHRITYASGIVIPNSKPNKTLNKRTSKNSFMKICRNSVTNINPIASVNKFLLPI